MAPNAFFAQRPCLQENRSGCSTGADGRDFSLHSMTSLEWRVAPASTSLPRLTEDSIRFSRIAATALQVPLTVFQHQQQPASGRCSVFIALAGAGLGVKSIHNGADATPVMWWQTRLNTTALAAMGFGFRGPHTLEVGVERFASWYLNWAQAEPHGHIGAVEETANLRRSPAISGASGGTNTEGQHNPRSRRLRQATAGDRREGRSGVAARFRPRADFLPLMAKLRKSG